MLVKTKDNQVAVKTGKRLVHVPTCVFQLYYTSLIQYKTLGLTLIIIILNQSYQPNTT